MGWRRHTPEQIIAKLPEAKIELAKGHTRDAGDVLGLSSLPLVAWEIRLQPGDPFERPRERPVHGRRTAGSLRDRAI